MDRLIEIARGSHFKAKDGTIKKGIQLEIDGVKKWFAIEDSRFSIGFRYTKEPLQIKEVSLCRK